MNGSLEMYKLSPIIYHNFEIALPTCMYNLKTIDETTRNDNDLMESPDQIISQKYITPINQDLDILAKALNNTLNHSFVEEKQQQILQQLNELKKQMNSIKAQLKIETPSQVITENVFLPLKENTNMPSDILIKANPLFPPYSLIIVQKLLENHLKMSFKSHIHSSILSLNSNALGLLKTLSDFKSKSNIPKINITIIWKNVDGNFEFFPTLTSSVQGEANFLRYLGRLIPNLLSYENNENVDCIDNILDFSFKIMNAKTKTEHVALTQIIIELLKKSEFLIGPFLTIADLAIYSVIKQTNTELNNNILKKWMGKCEQLK